MAEQKVRFPRAAYARRVAKLADEIALWSMRRRLQTVPYNEATWQSDQVQAALLRADILEEVHGLLDKASYRLAMLP